ncbi:hypothetical protein BHS07_10110 [Myxococcus xanthus]|nr:hypothetical protein BHS07_10110 [Myxococcus xanthus]
MNFRMMFRPLLGGLAVALVTACGSYKRDMEDACHAVERSKARELPIAEEEILTRAASWAAERARTSDGQMFWAAIVNINPQDKAKVLRDAAKEAGVVDCPLADALEATLRADELKRQ